MQLHYADGSRVHCGTVIHVKVRGVWMVARHEYDARGQSYLIVDKNRTIDCDHVEAIDSSTNGSVTHVPGGSLEGGQP